MTGEGTPSGQGANVAAAQRLLEDGSEIAALLAQNLTAAADREGRLVNDSDFRSCAATLLAGAWMMAKIAQPENEVAARIMYVDFLRRHADEIEQMDG